MALSTIAQMLVRDASRSWNDGSLQPTVLTYSFATAGGGFETHSGSVSSPLPADQQAQARRAFDAWAAVSGIHFVEVPDTFAGTGIDIRMRLGSTRGSFEASSPAGGGDITLHTTYGIVSIAPGKEGYGFLLLTIGYALGLNSMSESARFVSVMSSYHPQDDLPTNLRSADLEAIQYVYGTQQDEDALHIRWSWDNALHAVRHEGDDTSQRMAGTHGRDVMFGYGGDDTLSGGDGDDLLAAGTGINTVSGGAGIDTLVTSLFHGASSLPGLSLNNEGPGVPLSARGTLLGTNESTQFDGIEVIQFSDGRLVFDENDPVAQVVRLYQAALGRLPDVVGQEGWTTALMQGTPLASLAASFLDSQEFRDRFGNLDNPGFVTRAYQQALGREPDAIGQQYWQDLLASGLTRADLLVGFSESTENRAATQGLLEGGLWDADAGVVSIARLYLAVLGRQPDETGLRYWDSAMDHGTTLQQMAGSFANSTEFGARFGAADNGAFIDLVYANTLGRAPDMGGKSYWLDHLNNGMSRADLVLGFSESTEHVHRTSWLMEDGIHMS